MKRSAFIAIALAVMIDGIGVAHAGTSTAATTRIFQAIPGVSLDVCIDGTEVASSLAYRTTADGPSYEADTGHEYEFREADAGSCTGALVSGDFFFPSRRDKVVLISHPLKDGTPSSEESYLPPAKVRDGRTEFSVQHLARATKVLVAVDGERLITLEAGPRGGSSYIFFKFDAGLHKFAIRLKTTRELLAVETIQMREGVKWHLILHGNKPSGYGIRAFSRVVGVR